MNERAAGILVHGHAGVGKSTLGVSGPAPRLLMDSENSHRFIRQRKTFWKPMEEEPPQADGTWDLCVVRLKDWETTQQTYKWLNSGNHPFRSVSVDSISEIQVKAIEAINGRNAMKMQHWGVLLQNMGGLLRDLRDIVGDESSAIETMALISTSKLYGETLKPYLQGQIASQVPYLFDITGYLYVDQVANQETGLIEEKRVLFTGTHPAFEAKSRVAELPQRLEDPTLEKMLYYMFPPEQPMEQNQAGLYVPQEAPSN